ncbi:MAG: hypothetical protein ACFNW2_09730, partial [Streptococcus sanguinis]
QKNSFVENGHLVIRTQYQDGQWSAGGASSADAFAADSLIIKLNNIAEFKAKNNGELYEITFKDNHQFLTSAMEASEILRAIVDHAKENTSK